MNSLNKLRNKYKSLMMQQKMFITYTCSITVIVILILFVFTPVYQSYYTRQIKYSMKQSMDQAGNYVLNYLENMEYVSRILASDKEIDRIISRPEFGETKEVYEEYQEFFELLNALSKIEITSNNYQVGFYVSDDVVYSANKRYFYPYSELENMSEYDSICRQFENGMSFGTFSREEEEFYLLLNRLELDNQTGNKKQFVTRVSLPVRHLQEILTNSSVIIGGLVWLTDSDGTCITSSDVNYYSKIGHLDKIPEVYQKNQDMYMIEGDKYYVTKTDILGYGWNIYSLVPVLTFHRQVQFVWYLMFLILFCIVGIVALISYILSRYYVLKLSALNTKIHNLLEGDITITQSEIADDGGDEIDELYRTFYSMTQRLNHAFREHYRLGKSVKNAELKALQAQINPHFLYNTLDLINWGAMSCGANEVAEIAINLGKFYRLSLNRGKSILTIAQELEHVRTYVEIENVHFDGRIRFSADIPEDLLEYACLNIILQPFVENSIVHGIAKYSRIKELVINISAYKEASDIHILIEDNGQGISEEILENLNQSGGGDFGHSYGIKNINFRMKLCFGERYHAFFESELGIGTRVHILLPAISIEELEEKLH